MRYRNSRLQMMGFIEVSVLVSNIFTTTKSHAQAEDGGGASQQRMDPLISNAALGVVGDENQLSAFVIRDPTCANEWGPNRSATTVEAIIGAVYKDAGLDAARDAIQRIGVATFVAVKGR